jgi:GTPase Era involved in 16S rRNA processing
LRIFFVGTTHVGKSLLFNSLYGEEKSKVGYSTDTTTEIVIGSINIQGLGIIELFDLPGTDGLTNIQSAYIIDAIKKNRRRKNQSTQKEISVSNIKVVEKEFSLHKVHRNIILFLIDLFNGCKRDDVNLYKRISMAFPKTKMIIIFTKIDLLKKEEINIIIDKIEKYFKKGTKFIILEKKPSCKLTQDLWKIILPNCIK